MFPFGKSEHHGADRRSWRSPAITMSRPWWRAVFCARRTEQSPLSMGGGIWTSPEGINAVGNITGFYDEKAGAAVQGFLRNADGRIITFAGNPTIYLGLLPVSINDFDEIATNCRSVAGAPIVAAVPGAFV